MHDLLQDPMIGIRTPGGPVRVSLPGLLARLSAGDVEGYTGLRPHQADPWHVFLVQVAASILARRPATSLRVEQAFWREGLLELADGHASAWQLVVEDVTQPAFMQHPLESATELQESYRPRDPKARAPDELDVLVTSKNHDVKMARASAGEVEAWLYALLTYQTTSGFLGAGNYGSIRMNSGSGSRAVVSLVADPRPSLRFREELEVICNARGKVIGSHYGYRDRGVVLTWLLPWGRSKHQYTLRDLEPWFVESTRPLRFVLQHREIVALSAISGARQIGPKSPDGGDVGDPWTPINVGDKKKDRSALTISTEGWTPERLTKLLFQDGYELTPLQTPRSGEGDVWFVGSVIVRGQGKTEGFHRFAVPIPARTRKRLLQRDDVVGLGQFASELLRDAKEAGKSLRGALIALAEGGPESIDSKNDTIARWVDGARVGFSRGWEDKYFPTLWHAAELEERAPVRSIWQARLVERARQTLRDAEASMPIPVARRYRALVRAEGVLTSSMRKAGLLLSTTTDTREEEHA